MTLAGSIVPSLQRQSRAAFSVKTVRPPPTTYTASSSSSIRHLSNNKNIVDNLVTGVTTESIKQDAVVDDFMRSNFPEAFDPHHNDGKPFTSWGEARRNTPKPPLNIRPLSTLKRDPDTEEGSNRCFPMRKYDKKIPGIIYGSDPIKGITGGPMANRIYVKTRFNLLASEIDRYRSAFCSRVYDLTLYDNEEQEAAGEGGIVHRVLPKHLNVHPVTDLPYCCNFLRYYPGRPVKLPLLLINEEESPALKRDGYLIPINRFVECIIDDGVAIPEQLEVECTGLQFKQVIRLDRVIFPEGVRPSKKVLKMPDFMIGPIHGGRSAVDEDANVAEGAEGEEKEEKEAKE